VIGSRPFDTDRVVKIRPHLLVPTILLVTTAACGFSPRPGESIGEVCKKENDGKTLSVSGYLAAPKMMVFCGETCTLRLSEARVEREPTLITAFKVGEGAGTMQKLPEKFTSKDILVTDHAGETLGVGEPVRLTGKLMVSDSLCSMFLVDKIEAP
jgi:hypothetical protein